MAFGMELEIRGDASSIKTALRETKDEYRSTATDAVKNTNTMAEAAQHASRHIKAMENSAKGMASGFKSASTAAMQSSSDVTTSVSKSIGIMHEYDDALHSAEGATREYAKAMEDAAQIQSQAAARTAQANDTMRSRVARSFDAIQSKVASAARDISARWKAAMGAIETDSKRVEAAKERISKASEDMQRRSVRAFTAIKVAAAGLAAATVITGANFEQAMARVGAVTSATPAQLAAMTTEAKRWGSTTTYSAKSVAQAMGVIADSSGDAAETIAATGPVIKLAGATYLELSEAADLVSQTLDAFNLKGTEADRVVNVMAASIGKIDMNSLRAGLSNVAAAAGNVGLSVEQTVAMLAVLDMAGQKATKSAAGLQGIFSSLLNPSDELKKLMGGLTVEANGVMAVMQQLAEQGPAALSQAFDARQLQVIISLAKAGPEAFEAMTASLTGTSRALEMFEANQKTVSSQFAILKNMVGEVMIAAFQELSGVTLEATQTMQDAVARYKDRVVAAVASARDWVVEHKDMIASVVELALKVGPVILALGLMLKAVNWAIGAAQTLRAVWFGLKTAWVLVVPVINAVSVAMGGAAIATTAMAGPVGIVIIAVAALVGWMIKLRLESEAAAKVLPTTVEGLSSELAIAEMHLAKLYDTIVKEWGTVAQAPFAYQEMLTKLETRIGTLRAAQAKMTSEAVKGYGEMTHSLLELARAGATAQAATTGSGGGGGGGGAAAASVSAFTTPSVGIREMDTTKSAHSVMVDQMAADWQTYMTAEETASALRQQHQDEYIAKYMEDNLLQAGAMQALGDTYDDVVEMMIRKEESRHRIFIALQNNFRRQFIGSVAAMFKALVTEKLKASVMSQALVEKSAAREKFLTAKEGARRAYNAMAAVPIVGPALGAVAAAAAFTFLMAFHKGGYIGAMMQPQRGNERIINTEVGEYVVNKRSVDTLGKDTLDFMNRTGRLPDRAGSGGGVFSPIFNFHGDGNFVAGARSFVQDELVPFIEEAISDGRLRGTLRPTTS